MTDYTIFHIMFLTEVEAFARKNPRGILKVYEAHIQQHKPESKIAGDEQPLLFTDVCDDKTAKML